MEINTLNPNGFLSFFKELKELLEKHKVEIDGFGSGWEVDENVVEFSTDGGYIETLDFGSINSKTIDVIIEKIESTI